MSTGLFGRLQDELEARDKAAGLSMADILILPDPLRRLMNWLLRQEEPDLPEVAAFLDQDEANTRAMLGQLIEKGFVRELKLEDRLYYRVRLKQRRSQMSGTIWEALGGKTEE